MKLHFAVVLSIAWLMVGPVWAQTSTRTAPATSDAPMKFAVINIQQAIASTDEGQQAAAQLQSQFTPRRDELDKLSKQIQDLQERLQNGERTLSDEEKDRLAAHGQQLTREYQRKQQELTDDANDARTDAINTIGQKMVKIIDKFARDNSYSMVLDSSAQGSPVLFASDAIDATLDIIKLYNQANPVKTGAAAPKPQGK
jgi:outer membrane protein